MDSNTNLTMITNIVKNSAIALKEINSAGPKALSDMFVTSENLLSVMDRITGLYAGLKA